MTRASCLALAACFALAGCTTTAVPVPEAEAYTVLLQSYLEGGTKRVGTEEARRVEAQIGACVADGMRERSAAARFVSAEEFRSAVFPGVARENMPDSPKSLLPLLAHEEFRRRAATLGLRHLVIVGGSTSEPAEGDVYGFCGAGPGAPPACLIIQIWSREAQLRAVVLDLAVAERLDGARAEAFATSWIAIVGLVPLWWPPPGFGDVAAKRACAAFGRSVAEALVTGKPQP